MKLVRNTTPRPLRVPLGGGKVLHLAPRGTGQVSDDSVNRAAFQKLLEAGSIEVLDGGQIDTASGGTGPGPRESTHGHQTPKVVIPKGNR